MIVLNVAPPQTAGPNNMAQSVSSRLETIFETRILIPPRFFTFNRFDTNHFCCVGGRKGKHEGRARETAGARVIIAAAVAGVVAGNRGGVDLRVAGRGRKRRRRRGKQSPGWPAAAPSAHATTQRGKELLVPIAAHLSKSATSCNFVHADVHRMCDED